MLKKHINNFSSLLGFVLLGISIAAIHHELREYNYRDIFNSLVSLPPIRLYLAIGLTSLSYAAMAYYDTVSFRHIGNFINYKKVLFTGFISAAATNTVGFAFLTGSAIRYRYYSTWGVSAIEIAQVIAFENVSFCLGLFTVSGLMFLFNPLVIPPQLHLPFLSLRLLGVVFLLIVATYIVGSILSKKSLIISGHEFRFPSLRIALIQVGLSSLDWLLAGAVLYVLLPFTASLSYWGFLGIFLLAMIAVVVSNVPGGLGVFETVILLLLSPKIPATTVFGSLLAYRGVYYFLPLGVATGLMGFYEIAERLKRRSP
ncbi:MAG: lysylphosphatidylglycerol synthase domain-containing protein [Cyanobacteriota bacterium]|nr:lysylphosphatidylglycerol synthase domain-containing protein [Cyanobacteriota bacterium]